MKMALFLLLCLAVSQSHALPNAVFGALAQLESPLNDEDLTELLLAAEVWEDSSKLPGDWHPDTGIGGVEEVEGAYLLARPRVFGLPALLVRSMKRGDQLSELQITFADAGSFFGYLDRRIPDGLSAEQAAQLQRERLEQKAREFGQLYEDRRKSLEVSLREIDDRPREMRRGRTRDLRAESLQFDHAGGGLAIELFAAKDRLLRVTIRRGDTTPKSWLDPVLEKQSASERQRTLVQKVSRTEEGDVFLPQLEVVPQGFRPYCGLNTLVMVGRYLGLHLDEDFLAVAGGFQNTGSAAGSDMLGLYAAVAREAKVKLTRSSDYRHEVVRRSIRAGMPVIVWRRWDRARDQLHSQLSKELAEGKKVRFERPDPAALPSREKRSPLHASVIVGYNDARQEVLFLESWDGQKVPRRMPVSEISATTDWSFSFLP